MAISENYGTAVKNFVNKTFGKGCVMKRNHVHATDNISEMTRSYLKSQKADENVACSDSAQPQQKASSQCRQLNKNTFVITSKMEIRPKVFEGYGVKLGGKGNLFLKKAIFPKTNHFKFTLIELLVVIA